MVLEALLLLVFAGSLFGLVQTYFLYPASLWILARFRSVEGQKEGEQLPEVALIIAAYNEEEVIAQKIENSLDLTYPDGKLDIVVFSDASSDRTDEIVREYEDDGVELVRIEGRVGKTACQNRVAEQVDADILVFSDANSMYEPDAVDKLVESFAPGVGCVVGELRYRDSSDVEGESFYWRYESLIKRLESRVNSLVTGNGSIYAVRAESYVSLPADSISDFTQPLEVVRQGQRVTYAPEATAWEETGESAQSELSRRVRIVTRSWNSVVEYLDLLNPVRHPLFSYQLWSHKILRWLSPLLLVSVFVANIGLAVVGDTIVYELLLTIQVIFYTLAAVGGIADRLDVANPVFTYIPFYFVYSNYGLLVGLSQFVAGKNVVAWETATRDAE